MKSTSNSGGCSSAQKCTAIHGVPLVRSRFSKNAPMVTRGRARTGAPGGWDCSLDRDVVYEVVWAVRARVDLGIFEADPLRIVAGTTPQAACLGCSGLSGA